MTRADRRQRHQEIEAMTTLRSNTRTEAFSDGVMAIAITLLILNVHIDSGYASAHGLLRALNHEWPAYLAYITAFLTIAIMWLNHHALFDKIRQVDKSLAWTNLALLLTISILPFPTSVVAQYLRAGGTDAKVAVSFYGLLSVFNGFAWLGSWVHLARYPELLHEPYDAAYARLERRRTAMGVATYAAATAIAWLAPIVALLLFLAAAIFYAVTSSGSRLPEPSEVSA
jgi:TMEM175 potassium channel family protein